MTLDEAQTTIHLAKIGTDVSPETWLRVAEVLTAVLAATEAERDALQAECGRVSVQGAQLAVALEKAKAEAAHLASNQLADGAERNLASDVDTMRERAESAEREVSDVLRVLHGKDEFPLLSTAMVARQVLAELKARAEKAEKSCAAIGEWVHEYGAALKPVGADTFGEGVRESKSRVRALLADDAGKDYVHRDVLMQVAERVRDACRFTPYLHPVCGHVEDASMEGIDLAAIVKEVAP